MSFPSTARKSSASMKSSSSSFASSSSSTFSSPCIGYFRSSTTTRSSTTLSKGVLSSLSSQSVRFGLESAISPSRSISAVARDRVVRKEKSSAKNQASSGRRMCMCSPTTHPGSFRCSFHKNLNVNQAMVSSSNRLNARRSAMRNSLVRIGTAEGDLMKRALATLIRPSSHQQRRHSAFEARPSRLSFMSRASEAEAISSRSDPRGMRPADCMDAAW